VSSKTKVGLIDWMLAFASKTKGVSLAHASVQ